MDDRRDLADARADLAARLAKWQARSPRRTAWAEAAIEASFTSYRLPRRHHKHLESTNRLERFNEEIKRRTDVVRIVPDAASCCRLGRALAAETPENWLGQTATATWTTCATSRSSPAARPHQLLYRQPQCADVDGHNPVREAGLALMTVASVRVGGGDHCSHRLAGCGGT